MSHTDMSHTDMYDTFKESCDQGLQVIEGR